MYKCVRVCHMAYMHNHAALCFQPHTSANVCVGMRELRECVRIIFLHKIKKLKTAAIPYSLHIHTHNIAIDQCAAAAAAQLFLNNTTPNKRNHTHVHSHTDGAKKNKYFQLLVAINSKKNCQGIFFIIKFANKISVLLFNTA